LEAIVRNDRELEFGSGLAALAVAAVVLIDVSTAAGSTVTAASCSRADVRAAIISASDGDTVVVPAGTCSWTGGVSFNKGIHLTGVGVGAVTLIHDAGTSYLLEVTEHATHLTEISRLRFVEGSGTADAHLAVYPGGRPVLVHDNYFETNNGLLRSIRWMPNRGVIWNNEFYSNQQDDGAIVFVDDTNVASWSTASTMGMDDPDGESNVYVEDNLFREIFLGALDPDSNSRVVIRHNTFDNAAMASHGADTSLHGTRHWEIYDNDFIFTDHGDCDGSLTLNLNWFFYARGGTGVITDNILPDISSCAWGDKTEIYMTVQNIRRNSGPYPCWTTYPAPHQIGQSHDGVGPVTEPVHIWNNPGGGVHGIGDYEPDECGNGQTAVDYIQEGRDYVLGPKPAYTKFPYPHPLRAPIFADGFETGDTSAWSVIVP
jgi:hypothetical protein